MSEVEPPAPETQGKLGPPRRRPPTALGADTLPPPRGRPPAYLSTSALHTFARAIALSLVAGLLILVLWLVAPAILPTVLAGLTASLLAVALVYFYRDRLSFLTIALAPLAAGGITSAASTVRVAPGFTEAAPTVILRLIVGLGLGLFTALAVSVLAFAWLRAWHVHHGLRVMARIWESARRDA